MQIQPSNPKTLYGKVLVGYQGWFTCPGDGEPVDEGHHGWIHWFNHPIPWEGGRPNTDLWPDVSEYSPSELYPAPGLKMKNGEPAFLFSSRSSKTVRRHFNWMAKTGVDGAFLQRFLGQCDVLDGGNIGIRRIRDEVGDRVREAAEQEGRVFAIMYDVTGVSPDRMLKIFQHDWPHLIRSKEILDSPNYLRHNGRPVLTIWGLGMNGNNHTPALVHQIASFLRSNTPGGLYLVAGTPTHWRTSQGDADPNPEFLNVWLNDFDCISPWTVGRFSNENDVDGFYGGVVKDDIEFLHNANERNQNGRKIDYLPVILPGGSGCNLSEGKWKFNDIPRQGGRFLWRQLYHAYRLARDSQSPHVIKSIYGAMWDEYDEGTAYLPVVSKNRQLPIVDDPKDEGKWNFLSLEEDGYDLPSDWYMRILGLFGEALRNERRIHESLPSKELHDYWSSRPKYIAAESAAASSSGANEDYKAWLETQKKKDGVDEPPPPPYSLEEEASSAPAPGPSTSHNPTQAPTQSENVAASSFSSFTSPSTTSDAAVSSISNSLAQVSVSEPAASVSPPLPPRNPVHPPPMHPDRVPQGAHRVSPGPDVAGVGGFAPPPVHPSRPGRNPSYTGRMSSPSPTPAQPSAPSNVGPPSQWPPPHWDASGQKGDTSANIVGGFPAGSAPGPNFPAVSFPSFPSEPATGPTFPSGPNPTFSTMPQGPPSQIPQHNMSSYPGQHFHSPTPPPGPHGLGRHPSTHDTYSSSYGSQPSVIESAPSTSTPYWRPGSAGPGPTPGRADSPYRPEMQHGSSLSYNQHSSSPVAQQFPSGPSHDMGYPNASHEGSSSTGQDNIPDYLRPSSGVPYGGNHNVGYNAYGPRPSASPSPAPSQPPGPHSHQPSHTPPQPAITGAGYPGHSPSPGSYTPQYIPPHGAHHDHNPSMPPRPPSSNYSPYGHTQEGPGAPPRPQNSSPSPYGQPPGGHYGDSSHPQNSYGYPQAGGYPPPPGHHSSLPPGSSGHQAHQSHAGGYQPPPSPYGGQQSYSPAPASHPYNTNPSSSSSAGGQRSDSGMVNYALSAVDKFAGKKVAGQVGSLAASGGKLLGKFTK